MQFSTLSKKTYYYPSSRVEEALILEYLPKSSKDTFGKIVAERDGWEYDLPGRGCVWLFKDSSQKTNKFRLVFDSVDISISVSDEIFSQIKNTDITKSNIYISIGFKDEALFVEKDDLLVYSKDKFEFAEISYFSISIEDKAIIDTPVLPEDRFRVLNDRELREYNINSTTHNLLAKISNDTKDASYHIKWVLGFMFIFAVVEWWL